MLLLLSFLSLLLAFPAKNAEPTQDRHQLFVEVDNVCKRPVVPATRKQCRYLSDKRVKRREALRKRARRLKREASRPKAPSAVLTIAAPGLETFQLNVHSSTTGADVVSAFQKHTGTTDFRICLGSSRPLGPGSHGRLFADYGFNSSTVVTVLRCLPGGGRGANDNNYIPADRSSSDDSGEMNGGSDDEYCEPPKKRGKKEKKNKASVGKNAKSSKEQAATSEPLTGLTDIVAYLNRIGQEAASNHSNALKKLLARVTDPEDRDCERVTLSISGRDVEAIRVHLPADEKERLSVWNSAKYLRKNCRHLVLVDETGRRIVRKPGANKDFYIVALDGDDPQGELLAALFSSDKTFAKRVEEAVQGMDLDPQIARDLVKRLWLRDDRDVDETARQIQALFRPKVGANVSSGDAASDPTDPTNTRADNDSANRTEPIRRVPENYLGGSVILEGLGTAILEQLSPVVEYAKGLRDVLVTAASKTLPSIPGVQFRRIVRLVNYANASKDAINWDRMVHDFRAANLFYNTLVRIFANRSRCVSYPESGPIGWLKFNIMCFYKVKERDIGGPLFLGPYLKTGGGKKPEVWYAYRNPEERSSDESGDANPGEEEEAAGAGNDSEPNSKYWVKLDKKPDGLVSLRDLVRGEARRYAQSPTSRFDGDASFLDKFKDDVRPMPTCILNEICRQFGHALKSIAASRAKGRKAGNHHFRKLDKLLWDGLSLNVTFDTLKTLRNFYGLADSAVLLRKAGGACAVRVDLTKKFEHSLHIKFCPMERKIWLGIHFVQQIYQPNQEIYSPDPPIVRRGNSIVHPWDILVHPEHAKALKRDPTNTRPRFPPKDDLPFASIDFGASLIAAEGVFSVTEDNQVLLETSDLLQPLKEKLLHGLRRVSDLQREEAAKSQGAEKVLQEIDEEIKDAKASIEEQTVLVQEEAAAAEPPDAPVPKTKKSKKVRRKKQSKVAAAAAAAAAKNDAPPATKENEESEDPETKVTAAEVLVEMERDLSRLEKQRKQTANWRRRFRKFCDREYGYKSDRKVPASNDDKQKENWRRVCKVRNIQDAPAVWEKIEADMKEEFDNRQKEEGDR
jgi:hypothetical protein